MVRFIPCLKTPLRLKGALLPCSNLFMTSDGKNTASTAAVAKNTIFGKAHPEFY